MTFRILTAALAISALGAAFAATTGDYPVTNDKNRIIGWSDHPARPAAAVALEDYCAKPMSDMKALTGNKSETPSDTATPSEMAYPPDYCQPYADPSYVAPSDEMSTPAAAPAPVRMTNDKNRRL